MRNRGMEGRIREKRKGGIMQNEMRNQIQRKIKENKNIEGRWRKENGRK